MIHVVIYQNEKEECTGFQTEGHAEYADPGQDIVVAHKYNVPGFIIILL